MAHTWILILILSVYYSAPASSAVVSQRNIFQFKHMINYKGYPALDYNGYGCWCGIGNHGPLTVDATDECCRTHDLCYRRISGGFFGCSPKMITYVWREQSNKVIQCTDPIDSCDRNTCECDKAAADCFANHRSTYRSSFLLKKRSELSEICNP